MNKKKILSIVIYWLCFLILFFQIALSAEPSLDFENYWPQWRGPLVTGEAPHGNPPIQWDENTNIRWKTPVNGLSHATPVVWGNRIFILTTVPADKKKTGQTDRIKGIFDTYRINNALSFDILALNRTDGSLLWRRTARIEVPHEGIHEDGSWASCSPVTDGEYVIAPYGSYGFYCYDMDGNLQWEKDFGEMHIRYQYGESSSPALHKGKLVIPWDHEGDSFIATLDVRTGKEIWRVNRNDGTSWSTPLVVEHEGKTQLVTTAIRRVRSYDLNSGMMLWETRDMTAGPIPSPAAANGIVYVMGGYRESILQAISLSKAHGNAAASNSIAWELDHDTSYVSSPLVYDGILYFIKDYKNFLSCYNARTGEPYYIRQRLNGISDIYSSPAAAQGRVYIAGRNGMTLVIKHGVKFEVLAQNKLNDSFDASPVIVGTELYLRGHNNLYCISQEKK
ncbi:MAG: PQQ-binding-like beta-propeller repeat protein [Candidatus Latescibacteria bacterium]|nr:PQQ-binding-like beta-propeller repeat protein [Candidatus Latescibacterota bacterium]